MSEEGEQGLGYLEMLGDGEMGMNMNRNRGKRHAVRGIKSTVTLLMISWWHD